MQPTRILARQASRALAIAARQHRQPLLQQRLLPAMMAASSSMAGRSTTAKAGFATSLPFGDFQKFNEVVGKAQEHMDEGIRFMESNMIPLAMSSFQKSLNAQPSSTGHYNMGVGYFMMGDYRSAIRSFEESLKLNPARADAHTNIATAHVKLNKDLDLAQHHLQAAADITPDDAEVQFNLGVVSEQKGDLDTAIKGYKAALDLGIETASVNLRNASAKKLAQVAKEQESDKK
ncbi:hypothetical protein DFQ27_003178 [Actinomortierella ambigua]|uniref:TPR-like protein n=1 Tax=Actinomortierella ambigua TaxID=1343610 RepID=A0A9P6Q882_9FUNG|nr:hypothetical protein DFQ27_003178 [Actinomortierella ambigua]